MEMIHDPKMTIDFTKIVKHYEMCNDMCHNFYFLVYGKIRNADKTRFRRFKFMVWFDIFDVQEYADSEVVTDNDIRGLAEELAMNTCDSYIKSYDDTDEFYAYCNKSINDWNNLAKNIEGNYMKW